jgi:hypothetical protein
MGDNYRVQDPNTLGSRKCQLKARVSFVRRNLKEAISKVVVLTHRNLI